MANATQFDVTIIGAGLAGATLAIALQQISPHLNIAVVEQQLAASTSHSSFDGRALAISYGSKQLLAQWGIWSDLADIAGSIKKIEISDEQGLGYCQLNHESHNLDALGYVLEAQMIGAVVSNQLQHLASNQQLSLFCPEQLVGLIQGDDSVELELSSGKKLLSTLVIGADGINSRLRQLLKIEQNVWDFAQSAITCNVLVDNSHDVAFERFTAQGPLAMLPLSENRLGLVWCQDNDKTQTLLELNDDNFMLALQQAFGFRAGKILKVSKRHRYPLTRVLAKQYYHHRCLLIANAAHSIHPIAGQGLNLGLRDISHAIQAIQKNLSLSKDIGCYQAWANYLEQRQQDIDFVLTTTESLVHIFSNKHTGLKFARNQALSCLNQIPILKRAIAAKAMGFTI